MSAGRNRLWLMAVGIIASFAALHCWVRSRHTVSAAAFAEHAGAMRDVHAWIDENHLRSRKTSTIHTRMYGGQAPSSKLSATSVLQLQLQAQSESETEEQQVPQALQEGTTLDPSICSSVPPASFEPCMSAVRWSSQPLHAQGCKYLFLDVGSNIGMHVRFLYEPQLYRPAHAYDCILDEAFGAERTTHPEELCAIGFEPNPSHRQRHQDLSIAYAKMGWRYRALYVAVSGYSDPTERLTFYKQDLGEQNDWGFSMANTYGNKDTPMIEVPLLNLGVYLNKHIGPKQPSFNKQTWMRPQHVLMKMDIEGSEYSTLPQMMELGSFEHIDTMTYEFHPRFCPIDVKLDWNSKQRLSQPQCEEYERNFPSLLRQGGSAAPAKEGVPSLLKQQGRRGGVEFKGFSTRLSDTDDEKHRLDGQPLPNPNDRRTLYAHPEEAAKNARFCEYSHEICEMYDRNQRREYMGRLPMLDMRLHKSGLETQGVKGLRCDRLATYLVEQGLKVDGSKA